MSTQVMDYAVRRPIGDRINFRLITIIAVFSLLVGYPVYALVRDQVSHGIQKHGDRLDVNLKKLGYFPFNDHTGSVDDIPPDLRSLDGKRVALEGYIAPTSISGDKVTNFEFVYNVQKCCYGGPPQVQERVFAITAPGTAIQYTDEEIRLIGKLHVNLTRDKTGKVLTVYTMDISQVEPL